MESFIDMLSKIPELLRCVRKIESGVERILPDETICVQEARVLRKNLRAEKTEKPHRISLCWVVVLLKFTLL